MSESKQRTSHWLVIAPVILVVIVLSGIAIRSAYDPPKREEWQPFIVYDGESIKVIVVRLGEFEQLDMHYVDGLVTSGHWTLKEQWHDGSRFLITLERLR